ncbi:MAG TPA: hypothetical protein VM124_03900, partial [Candidatus Limnocylindrales bacterium]|nr:hypothetical protein [Candidatus Limnocylindrales bacterium]
HCEVEALGYVGWDDSAFANSLATTRITVCRDIVSSPEHAGDNYAVTLDWLSHDHGSKSPGTSRVYSLWLPQNANDKPELLICHQRSLTATELPNNSFRQIIGASYYGWERGTEYDAAQMFDELSVMAGALMQLQSRTAV